MSKMIVNWSDANMHPLCFFKWDFQSSSFKRGHIYLPYPVSSPGPQLAPPAGSQWGAVHLLLLSKRLPSFRAFTHPRPPRVHSPEPLGGPSVPQVAAAAGWGAEAFCHSVCVERRWDLACRPGVQRANGGWSVSAGYWSLRGSASRLWLMGCLWKCRWVGGLWWSMTTQRKDKSKLLAVVKLFKKLSRKILKREKLQFSPFRLVNH